MTKVSVKKEERKKLIVRIVCMALVIALVVTSLLTMFPSLFQDNSSYTLTLEDLVAMGLIELDEDGNIIAVDESLLIEEDHEGHDHE